MTQSFPFNFSFRTLTMLAIGSAFFATSGNGNHAQQQKDPPLVIAHYMHCYVLGGIPSTDSRVQSPSALLDLKHWPPLSQESEWFTTAESAIAASGISSAQADLQTAEHAGVDAFGLLLSPNLLPRSSFSSALNLLASAAEHQQVKLIPELWINAWSQDALHFGQNVKQFMDAHPGAFVTRQGRPMFVIEFDDLAKHIESDDQGKALQALDDLLAPWGGTKGAFTIFYLESWKTEVNLKSPLLAKCDAFSIWTPQDDWSVSHSSTVSEVGRALAKPFAWPVAPAFYQRRAGGQPMEYANSFGAARYIDAWFAANRIHPAFIDIQTWNDFSEDSAILPTNTSGDNFLILTQYLSAWFKAGAAPKIDSEVAMMFHPKQLSNATLSNPQAKVKNYSWRHGSPVADYIDVVTLLKTPAIVRVSLGSQSWQQPAPAGLHEWLIYAAQTNASTASEEVNPGPNSYPTPNAYRSVTVADTFSADGPQLEMLRSQRSAGSLSSKCPFLGAGIFQDLTVIGDEIKIPQ